VGCTFFLAACGDDDGAATPTTVTVPAQTLVSGASIPQFASPLPTLSVAGGTMPTLTGNQPLTIHMCEFWANVLPQGTFTNGVQPKTRVWGYVSGAACPPNGPDDPALDTYIGPVIISKRNDPAAAPTSPTTITWVNDLGTTDTTQVLAYKTATDQTLHWADPNQLGCKSSHLTAPTYGTPCAAHYVGPIPAVVHLHGGEVPAALDGGPDAWFSSQAASGFTTHGPGYYSMNGADANSATYAYPNVQEAAPLWFHDHTLGATTLNVYAGLAGGYLLVDPNLPLPSGLTATGLSGPGGKDTTIIPLAIQDRAFDTNGQLFYPAGDNGGMQWSPNPEHPFWNPEIFLDTIVVNGKAWPYLDVEPKRYRFLIIEGSNSRAYQLSLVNQASNAPGPAIWVIGTEEGYIDAPVALNPASGQQLVMMPGERYDVIVDFSGLAPGTDLLLANTAATPYPSGTAPDPATTGRVMQFRVGACTSGGCGAQDPSYDPATGVPILTGSNRLVRFSDPISGKLVPNAPIAKRRALTLNDITHPASTAPNPATGLSTNFPGGSVMLLLNNTLWSGQSDRTYDDFTTVTLDGTTMAFSELPREGDAELWEIVNLTMDAHPIHTHLTDVQLVNRQAFDMNAYMTTYDAAFPGGVYIPGFGPPLNYDTGDPAALGGNPDVTPYLMGTEQPPGAYEEGWKDTVIAPPGYVTRFVVRYAPSSVPLDAAAALLAYPFDPSDPRGYPWHCHITTHEDNEMMRAVKVQLNPAAPPPSQRPVQQGRDY
jgi:FtsP/CotA-like multicopper oxidase with cupredoxin domain